MIEFELLFCVMIRNKEWRERERGRGEGRKERKNCVFCVIIASVSTRRNVKILRVLLRSLVIAAC